MKNKLTFSIFSILFLVLLSASVFAQALVITPSPVFSNTGLTCSGANPADYKFSWYKNGVLQGNNNLYTYPSSQTVRGDRLICRISLPGFGDIASSSEITIQNSPPVVSITGFNNLTEGLVSDFTATASDPIDGDAIASWNWNFGDGNTATTANAATNIYLADGTYTVTVTVTDAYGATGQDSVVIGIPDSVPVADFTAVNYTVGAGEIFTLSDNTSPSVDIPLTYEWDIDNDGTFDYFTQNIIFQYDIPAVYTVVFNVTDSDGDVSSVNKDITVIPCNPPTSGDWTILGNAQVTCDSVTIDYLDNIFINDNVQFTLTNSILDLTGFVAVSNSAILTIDNSNVIASFVDLYDSSTGIYTNSYINTTLFDVSAQDTSTLTITNSTIESDLDIIQNSIATITDLIMFGVSNSIEVEDFAVVTFQNVTTDYIEVNDASVVNIDNSTIVDLTLFNNGIANVDTSNIEVLTLFDSSIANVDNTNIVLSLDIMNSAIANVDTTIIDTVHVRDNVQYNSTASQILTELSLESGLAGDNAQITGDITFPGPITLSNGIAANTIQRFYDITVEDLSAVPIAGAVVELRDSVSTVLFSGTTDVLGFVQANLTVDSVNALDIFEIYVDGNFNSFVSLVTSTPITVTVGGLPNITTTNPATPLTINEGDLVNFNATVDDPELGNLTADWDIDGTPAFNEIIVSGGTSIFGNTFAVAGSYNVTVVMTDNQTLTGFVTSDESITVTVQLVISVCKISSVIVTFIPNTPTTLNVSI